MAENQPIPKDPIQTRSLSVAIFVASAALMASVALAGWDEFVWRRPYKTYQHDFVTVYQNYLDVLLPRQQKKWDELEGSDEYQAIQARLAAAQKVVAEKVPPISDEINLIAANIDRLNGVFKVARSEFSALTYEYETASGERARENVNHEMERVKRGPYPATVVGANGAESTKDYTFAALGAALEELRVRKAALGQERGRYTQPVGAISKELNEYVSKNFGGVTPANLAKLIRKNEDKLIGPGSQPINEVVQIHIAGELRNDGWVDRCESCHVGTREPVDMSLAMVMASTPDVVPAHLDHIFKETAFALQTTLHRSPTAEEVVANLVASNADRPEAQRLPEEDFAALALAVADAEDYRVFTTHPNRKLLEIHDPESFGCSMCHNGNGRSTSTVELAHGLNKYWLFPLHARENYDAGCVQCHSDDIRIDHAATLNEGKRLFDWRGCWGCHKYEGFNTQPAEIAELEKSIAGNADQRERLEILRKVVEVEQAQAIDMTVSNLLTEYEQLVVQMTDLETERQKVGPDLRNIRDKVKRDWLLSWIAQPHDFRPSTKMPSFFENLDAATASAHATKIAAFIWQSGRDTGLSPYGRGEAAEGQRLFESRGCLGCHVMTKDGQDLGDGFAANLSRMGEKANYDFIVRWVHQPDSGVMPSLRLTTEESQHIATYLTSLKTAATYASAPQLDDPRLFAEGEALTKHYGCAGCHWIGGLEDESGIGTELTEEGSKPKERLDFGRVEHNFKMQNKWTHKHFFEWKLREPGIFGTGKLYHDDLERLKMPNFRLAEDDITALSTFLIGSVQTEIPEDLQYNPDAFGKAVQEGWWVVQKYNCTGCHQFEPGVEPKLWSNPVYVGKDDQGDRKDRRPPTLVGQGLRTDSDWLARFLRNPALVADPEQWHRNGVRGYLDVRMPTFRLSQRELRKLVAFFGALSKQPTPAARSHPEPLTAQELTYARDLFKGVQCVKCHMIGEADWDSKANAPPLVITKDRLKPEWTSRWLDKPSLMVPGTQMPQNFAWEYEVRLKDGRTVIGIGFDVSRDRQIMKTMDGEEVRFTLGDVADGAARQLRMIANPTPDSIKSYTGDHRDLIMRYLHLNYDEAEIPITMPE